MRSYRRVRIAGGSYFFMVNLAERRNNDLLLRQIDALRDAFRRTKRDHPFATDVVCILPDHLHCIWRLPEGDADFSIRWSLIKQGFSRAVPAGERVSASRRRKGERGIWQRRYWEHAIRNDDDYRRHADAGVRTSPQPTNCVVEQFPWRCHAYCLMANQSTASSRVRRQLT